MRNLMLSTHKHHSTLGFTLPAEEASLKASLAMLVIIIRLNISSQC